MGSFVEHPEFSKLNVGFALDEGIASENDNYLVFYGERNIWDVKVTCPGNLENIGSLEKPGNPGHGSKFIENSAAEKFVKIFFIPNFPQ